MYLPNTAMSYIHTTTALCCICTYTHATFHAVPPYGFLQKACSFFLNGDIYFRNFMVGGHPQGIKEATKKNCSVLSSQTRLMLLPLKHVFVIGKTAVCPVFPGYYGFFPFSGSVLSFPISKHISMPNFSQLA